MSRDDTHKISEWYNTLSPSYDELYGQEQSVKHDRIIEYLRNRNFGTLIDIGCGTGKFLRNARQLYEYGIGIDLSKKMLQIAKKRITKNSDLIQAVSKSLPIRKDSIDCTVSVSMKRADSSLLGFFGEVERISRKNSFLVLTLFHEPQIPVLPILANSNHTSEISSRETLYFIRLESGH